MIIKQCLLNQLLAFYPNGDCPHNLRAGDWEFDHIKQSLHILCGHYLVLSVLLPGCSNELCAVNCWYLEINEAEKLKSMCYHSTVSIFPYHWQLLGFYIKETAISIKVWLIKFLRNGRLFFSDLWICMLEAVLLSVWPPGENTKPEGQSPEFLCWLCHSFPRWPWTSCLATLQATVSLLIKMWVMIAKAAFHRGKLWRLMRHCL